MDILLESGAQQASLFARGVITDISRENRATETYVLSLVYFIVENIYLRVIAKSFSNGTYVNLSF